MQDIRYALRSISARPWFAAAIVATLALGIGINTAVFSLANSVVLEPLPFPDGDRIVTMANTRQTEPDSRMNVSWLDLEDYRAGTSSFESLEAAIIVGSVLAETSLPPEVVRTGRVSPGLLNMTGVAPVLGRSLQPSDGEPGAPAVVVLSHELWTNRYLAAPDVVGRYVRVDNQPATVVGVMPAGFQFPNREQMWTVFVPNEDERTKRDWRAVLVVGKLKPGVAREMASTEVQTVAAGLAAAHPDTNKEIGARILTFNERFNGGEIRIVFLLMLGAVGLVLVVVCANVANMMLTRTIARRRELALHAALGASGPRIVRQILTECLVLSLAGGVLGLGLAAAGVRAFDGAVRDVGKPSWIIFGLDYPALAYCVGLCLVAALLSGLVPAMRASRTGAAGVLKEGGRSGSHHGGRISAGLVICQFALAVVLLAGAGLLVRSFFVSQQRNDWIEADRIATARLTLPSERYADAAARHRFFADLQSRMAALPGVIGAGLASNLPGQGMGGVRIERDGQPVVDPAQPEATWQVIASPGYLATIGMAIAAGRDFDESDGAEGREAAIVTREFAERFWSGTNVVGRRFRTFTGDEPGPWITIVGVTGSMAHGSSGVATDPAIFIPLRQTDSTATMLFARAATDPSPMGEALRKLVQTMDPELPLADVELLDAQLARSRWAWVVFGTAFSIFAAAALLLSGVGLYAVMSQATARRTREIGIRIALGATRLHVLRTVVQRGVIQIATGLAGGLVLAWFATGAMRALLFGVTPHDPLVLGLSIAILVTVGFTACVLPARRAAALSPVRALASDD